MGTDFDNKTHAQMLEWLDHASSGEMQAAADRLVSAASEIRKIAEDLKVRPQWVEWKGQGADAFRTWSADLANATLRLGDYSEGVSKWLSEASNAVASAQASIPRTEAGAQANLEAALAARNDPDASEVAKKSAETLIESGKRNREEAAAQMRRLSQTYTFSSSQMTSLEKPAFPAMPQVIAPQIDERYDGRQDEHIGPGGGSAASGTGYVMAPGHGTQAAADVTTPAGSVGVSSRTALPSVSVPVDMGIDGVATLPDTPPSPVANPVVPSTGPRPDGLPSPTPGIIPPAPEISPTAPRNTSGGGRTTGLPRPSVSAPGVTPLGPGPVGRAPGPNGITGGRVVPPGPGRSAVGIPRGTVIGSENTHGTAPMGRAPGMGGVGPGVSPSAGGSGRRLAGEAGGMVGGRQQPGHGLTRPFTTGGSGLVRGGASEGSMRKGAGAHATGHDEGGVRPDYLVEDDETWQQSGRRVVPPVID